MSLTRRWFLVSFIALLLSNTAAVWAKDAADDAADDQAAVLKAYEFYRDALAELDGEQAAELVSEATIELYQQLRDHAVKSNRQTVEQLPLGSRMIVICLRHRVEPEKLHAMDGRAVFVYAVNQKWISKNSLAKFKFTVDQVDVAEDGRTAQAFPRGRDSDIRFSFVKEDERWRLDLRPILALADETFRSVARLFRSDENTMMLSTIQMVTGRKVDDSVWEPIGEE